MKDQVQVLFEQEEGQGATPALNQIWPALHAEVRTNVIRLLVDLALKLVLSQRQNQADADGKRSQSERGSGEGYPTTTTRQALPKIEGKEGEVRELC